MAYAEGELGVLRASARQPPEWVEEVIALLDSAIGQLYEREPAAHCALSLIHI